MDLLRFYVSVVLGLIIGTILNILGVTSFGIFLFWLVTLAIISNATVDYFWYKK